MNTHLLFTIVGFHLLVVYVPVAMAALYKWPNAWHHLLALFLGMLCGYIDLHSDDPQFPVLLLFGFGFFIAYSHPKNAWQFALLLASWIPIGQFLSILAERKTGVVLQEWVFSFIAFVPALIGTYAGVWVRRAVTQFNGATENLAQSGRPE